MAGTFLHPFSNTAHGEDAFINVVRADGSTLWDDTGKSYLDGLASLWYCQVGHNRPELIEAITTQINTLATYNTFAPFTVDIAAEAAEAVARVSPMPDGRVFFGCSGSEAIDTALKLARLIPQLRGDKNRQIIVRRARGYHGTNFGGTSAQGIAPNRENWGDLVPHMVEIPSEDIEAAARLFREHGDRIAAVITEPLQGAGGVFVPPEGYLEGLRKLCTDNGALLIFDEVINGFGRTGSWFASQTYGVTPDLITFAKGVTSGYQPVSGVIVARSVADVMESQEHFLRTGYTYSGHPVAMAAVLANISVIENEGLVDRANHLGTLFQAGFEAMKSDGLIENYEGTAAIWAADLGREAAPVRDKMLELGVVSRPIAHRIAMCPPLVMTDEEVGRMLDVMAEALAITG